MEPKGRRNSECSSVENHHDACDSSAVTTKCSNVQNPKTTTTTTPPPSSRTKPTSAREESEEDKSVATTNKTKKKRTAAKRTHRSTPLSKKRSAPTTPSSPSTPLLVPATPSTTPPSSRESTPVETVLLVSSCSPAAAEALEHALFDAAYRGRVTEVQRLVETKGVSVRARDRNGWTVLHWAVDCGQVAVLQYLARAAQTSQNIVVDWNATDNRGRTALHWAAKYPRSLPAVQYLLQELPSRVNHHSDDNDDGNNNNDGPSVLLDLNIQDRYGWTPLHYASDKGNLQAVKLLLVYARLDQHQPHSLLDLHRPSQQGETALDRARRHGHTQIVQLLGNEYHSPNNVRRRVVFDDTTSERQHQQHHQPPAQHCEPTAVGGDVPSVSREPPPALEYRLQSWQDEQQKQRRDDDDDDDDMQARRMEFVDSRAALLAQRLDRLEELLEKATTAMTTTTTTTTMTTRHRNNNNLGLNLSSWKSLLLIPFAVVSLTVSVALAVVIAVSLLLKLEVVHPGGLICRAS